MSVVHLLRGYDRATDRLAVQYSVPEDLLGTVVQHVVLEEDDRNAYGVYPLDRKSALAIAKIIGREMLVAKDLFGNEFFLESEADFDTVNDQIARIAAS